MSDQNTFKKNAAAAAMRYIEDGMLVGVGTGSTTNYFIDMLAEKRDSIRGAISSSGATEDRLKKNGIPVMTLADGDPDVYVDGADRFNNLKQLIKGGGGALTGEKIVASVSRKFICIADETKREVRLGTSFPLPIAVIPAARSSVARQILAMGGNPVYRNGFMTDNGNVILDIHDLAFDEPIAMEQKLNNIPGIVCNGIFALHAADVVLIGNAAGADVLA
ncbi:MAG: ribose 5-phosphate isomerase A [Legionellales bacterium]|nr:ribose 5-phosphate isomerase A [Legionellales bacterium]